MAFLDGSLTQRLSIVDVLTPANRASGAAVNMNAVDMSIFERIMYVLQVGVVSSGGTVDFKLQGATDSAFTTPVDLTGKAITQITSSTHLVKVGATAEDLNAASAGPLTLRYIRGVLTIGTNNVYTNVIAEASCGRYKPENKQNEVSTVAQTIHDTN